MKGTEVGKAIKEISPETKIIISVETVPADVKQSLLREGYEFDYLPLPAERQLILRKIVG